MRVHFYLTILLLFFLLSTNLQGQNYAPLLSLDKEWEIQESEWGGYLSCYNIIFDSVTVVPGVGSFYKSNSNYSIANYWFREDTSTQQVWYTESLGTGTETLLYDFSLVIGDTFSYGLNNNTYTVIDVNSIATPLGPRKIILFDGQPVGGFLHWIEGIGNMNTFFYPLLNTDPAYTLNKVWNGTTLVYNLNLSCSVSIDCSTPGNTYESAITSNSAMLYWSGSIETIDQNFLVRYKRLSDTVWNTYYSGDPSPILLDNLLPMTTYVWQVQKYCGGGSNTAFSTIRQFNTLTSVSTATITKEQITLHYIDGELYVNNSEFANATASIYSLEAKLVAFNSLGIGMSQFPISNLETGMYVIVVRAENNFVLVKKMILGN